MEIPQPGSDPYSPGDEVTIYLGEDDSDSQYHGVNGIVIKRLEDDFDSITRRDLDGYVYRIKSRSTREKLPIDFRHRDLVPTEMRSYRD